MTIDHADFVTASRIALDLASTPEVAHTWTDESACAGMTVGGLAHHLLGQVRNTVRLVGPTTSQEPIALLDHYARAAWVEAGPDDEANTGIRDGGNDAAEAGVEAVLAEARDALERLPDLLATPRDPDVVVIPWQGWALTTDDFLVTRAMELVVHSDDLAASVGLPTPTFPEGLLAPVLSLLGLVAARRHGQAAVVRALSRPQRAPADVSAF